MKRASNPGEPLTWGFSGMASGGAGLNLVDLGNGDEITPSYLGKATAWYDTKQVMLDITPRYTTISGVYRFQGGGSRDTRYAALGLSAGLYNGDFLLGPRFHNSRYQKFYGIKMVNDFTLDVLLGGRFAANMYQSYALRYPMGKGLFFMPGVYLNLSLAGQKEDEDGVFDVLLGLQFKFVRNGNAQRK